MKFKAIVEQKRIGFVEIEVPDEEWEAHTYFMVRRKMLKGAAAKALEDGARVDWQEPYPIEPTTSAWPTD